MKTNICLLSLIILCISCNVKPRSEANLPDKSHQEMDKTFEFVTEQLKFALECATEARETVTNDKQFSPRTIEKDGSLRLVVPRDWTSGFFPGSLWQTYAYTKDPFWREQANGYTWPIEEMKNFKGTHDIGFIVYNSFGQGYRFTGERIYKEVALEGARSLISRYDENVKAIRSWDWSSHWKYPVIIDNMLNLELLFWATQETGDSTYYHIAVDHANTTLANHFRPDHSSYHVIDYDPATGAARLKETHQGIAHESVWSRGQAWALYGYTMCYRFTKNAAYLEQAENIARFFFSQPDLAEDLIAYWDMSDPAIPDAPRDASASAIMASALFELATYASEENSAYYQKLADTILNNLTTSYQAKVGTHQGFLLLHSTGNYPKDDEIDAPINYADYYYLEALLRKSGIKNY